MGFLLPWGQMSYWGAQVIVNLFAAIPFIGPDLALLIRGDYVVGDAINQAPEHVQVHDHKERRGASGVHVADQPAPGHVAHEVLD